MKFRLATEADHPEMQDSFTIEDQTIKSIADAWVTDNEEGPRYWVVAKPYAYGQIRLQVWWERIRGEPYPSIFQEL